MNIRIGTRASKLALRQTEMVAAEIHRIFPEIEIEMVTVSTMGDRVQDKPLSAVGGQGVFVSEIEKMLTEGKIDMAVHSAKDMPIELAEGMEISAVLERGSYRDALIVKKNTDIFALSNPVIGTGSARRAVYIRKILPTAQIKGIRGNVDTRLQKLQNGEYNGILLAMAGIERLGLDMSDFEMIEFEYSDFLPAPCQGIIAVESKKDSAMSILLRKVNHEPTYRAFLCERSVLSVLNAGCNEPIGAYAHWVGERLFLTVSKTGDKTITGSAKIGEEQALAERLVSAQ